MNDARASWRRAHAWYTCVMETSTLMMHVRHGDEQMHDTRASWRRAHEWYTCITGTSTWMMRVRHGDKHMNGVRGSCGRSLKLCTCIAWTSTGIGPSRKRVHEWCTCIAWTSTWTMHVHHVDEPVTRTWLPWQSSAGYWSYSGGSTYTSFPLHVSLLLVIYQNINILSESVQI